MELDEIDNKIISALKEHGRWSTQKISKKIDVPITTVHHRIKKLEQNGIIKGYTVVLDQERMGNQVLGYILLTGDLSYFIEKKVSPFELINSLRKKEFIEEINSTTGSYDYIIKVRAKNMREFSNVLINQIRRVPGVKSTETLIAIEDEIKIKQ